MKSIVLLLVAASVVGCGHSSPRKDFELTFTHARYTPLRSEIPGRYEFGEIGGRAVLQLKDDLTFQLNIPGGPVNNPIQGYSGTYFVSKDSLKLSFERFLYWNLVPESTRRYVETDLSYYLPLLHRLTTEYSPSFFISKEGHQYIMRHTEFESIKDITDFEARAKTFVTEPDGRRIGSYLFMKVEVDSIDAHKR